MTDSRADKFAQIIVDYSTNVQPGDRVAITATTAAEPVLTALYKHVLKRGGHPHLLLELPDQKEIFLDHANDAQLNFLPVFHKTAFEKFDVLIKIMSQSNTRALTNYDSERITRWKKGLAPLLKAQLKRGADGSLRWLSTMYPTEAYAMEADMGYLEYQDFVYRACHADEKTPDPIAYWQNVRLNQEEIIKRIKGHKKIDVRGPNVDLSLSIEGRNFFNSAGTHNLPDGEIYTGPVENSANGWIRYSYPAIYNSREVRGVELTFKDGKVIQAKAEKNEGYLHKMLDIDAGARFIGEFAIGTNMEIDRFTRNILFDEKIGGTIHIAIGAGYPETGSQNKSMIHWDMICDMRQDSEILVDGDVIYKDGNFTL